MNLYPRLVEILQRHLSPINARTVLHRALKAAHPQANATECRPEQVGRLVDCLRPSLKLFVDAAAVGELIDELRRLEAPRAPSESRVDVAREDDILVARQRARELCADANAGSFVTLRVLTAVSELARNIVNYSVGGWVELKVGRDGFTMVAVDNGPGIRNLDEILSGRYRSKSGLGVGILGVKRMAQHFAIDSGALGTRVEARLTL